MEQNGQPTSPKIAYLIKRFPHLSETFILHEVLELERQGLSLRIFSLYKPAGKVNRAAEKAQAPITYLPQGFPFGWLHLLGGGAKRFLKNPHSFLRVCAIALIQFHTLSTLGDLFYAAIIANQVEQEKITHLHAHFANKPATVALLVHQFTGIPYSFTAHAKDIYLSRKGMLAYKMKNARFVVTCTEYNRKFLASTTNPDDEVAIHRIYHGLNLSVFPSEPYSAWKPSTRPLILSVARLVEKKGLVYLLQACRRLHEQGYEFKCRIIGEGPLRPRLEQQIIDMDLTDCVELWGAETHERVIKMYQQATLFALPCVVAENGDRDGIPNVLVEALYMGVPVVSTPVSGIPELVKSEFNGLLVPDRDSAALADAIARLLDNPRLREKFTVAGRQTVMTKFDMGANVEYLMNLFLNQEFVTSTIGASEEPILIPTFLHPDNANQTATFLHLLANNAQLDLKHDMQRKVG